MSNLSTPVDVETVRITSSSQSKLAQMNQVKALRGSVSDAKLDEAAQDFEAQFLAQMLGDIFATVGKNEVLGGGEGEEVYKSLLVDEYGKLISRSGGIGVADHVKREIIRIQEGQ